MANFSNIKIKSDKVNAEIYILYMIIDSYFAKGTGTTAASRYSVDYFLMKSEDRIKAEEQIIKKMEHLFKDRLEIIGKLNYELKVVKADGNAILWFRTGFEEVVCTVEEGGRKADLYEAYDLPEQQFYNLMVA